MSAFLRQAFSRRHLLWTLGILAFPFYLFPKGGLQISAVFLFVAAMQAIRWNPRMIIRPGSVIIGRLGFPLTLFVLYSILVQLTWALVLDEPGILIYSAYNICNLFVFVGVALQCLRSKGFARLLVQLTLVSVLLQTLLSAAGFGWWSGSFRNVVYFQNPNQLGYFSLLSAGILTVGVRMGLIRGIHFGVGILACIWLAQLSLSKAAMLAIVVLLFYGGLQTSVLTMGAVAVAMIIGLDLFQDRLVLIESQLRTVGEQMDDSLAGRGYDRIWLHPMMNLLGGGEGAVWRWGSFLELGEMHSSWGTVLFSYGVPGVIAMLYFFSRLTFRLGMASLVPLLSVLMYGFTHMGLRFLPLWIMFGFIGGLAAAKVRQRVQVGARSAHGLPRSQAPSIFR